MVVLVMMKQSTGNVLGKRTSNENTAGEKLITIKTKLN